MNHLHPVISSSTVAMPMIQRILQAINVGSWIGLGHDIVGHEGNPVWFSSTYGLREDRTGGGIVVRLECYLDPQPGQRDRVVVSFNFCEGEEITGTVNVAYDLEGRWYAYHEPNEKFAGHGDGIEMPLVLRLGIGSTDPGAQASIIDTENALGLIAEAARYTHEYCNSESSED